MGADWGPVDEAGVDEEEYGAKARDHAPAPPAGVAGGEKPDEADQANDEPYVRRKLSGKSASSGGVALVAH